MAAKALWNSLMIGHHFRIGLNERQVPPVSVAGAEKISYPESTIRGERRLLRYLRERVAGSKNPRRFGHALNG
jgi:hypothetical protein